MDPSTYQDGTHRKFRCGDELEKRWFGRERSVRELEHWALVTRVYTVNVAIAMAQSTKNTGKPHVLFGCQPINGRPRSISGPARSPRGGSLGPASE